MTKQEQNNLATRLQGGSGDRYELFDSILPLIRQTVTRYRAIEHADAVQEAYVAFDKALKIYDPAKGHFVCLAMICIENRLRDKMSAKAKQDGYRRSKRPDLLQIQPQGLALQSLDAHKLSSDLAFEGACNTVTREISTKPPPETQHDSLEDMLHGLPEEQKDIVRLRSNWVPWVECAKQIGKSRPQCARRYRLGINNLRKSEGISAKYTQR